MVIDALVGIVITGLMLSICLATVQISRQLMQTADERRQATAALQQLMEMTPKRPGLYRGTYGSLIYDVRVEETKIKTSVICKITASVRLKQHTYELSGSRWCELEARV
jgi:hypothetical protein